MIRVEGLVKDDVPVADLQFVAEADCHGCDFDIAGMSNEQVIAMIKSAGQLLQSLSTRKREY